MSYQLVLENRSVYCPTLDSLEKAIDNLATDEMFQIYGLSIEEGGSDTLISYDQLLRNIAAVDALIINFDLRR